MEMGRYLLLPVVAVRTYGGFQWDWLLVVRGMVIDVKTSVPVYILGWVQFGAMADPRLVWVESMTWGDTQWGVIRA